MKPIQVPLETGAAALDGSPYVFFFYPSKSGSTSWTIFFQGGGWCYDEMLCGERANTSLGSSTFWMDGRQPNPQEDICLNVDPETGELDQECNHIYMVYLDGASYSGNKKDVVPRPREDLPDLHFRGARNLDATLDIAFSKFGLDTATSMVVTGASAGGLATFLHVDHIHDRMKKSAPKLKQFQAFPMVGFFLDHAPYMNSGKSYGELMKGVVEMQELTDKLDPECRASFPGEEYKCFMSPHLQKFVKTPYYAFNSKYDAWQASNILQLGCYANWTDPPYHRERTCTDNEQAALLDYGRDFLDSFAHVTEDSAHGAFITSCLCHSCPIFSLSVSGTPFIEHYGKWSLGKIKGAEAIAVDFLTPNSVGDVAKECVAYP